MQLIRYDPFRDLQKMERDLEKFWGNGWGLLPAFTEPAAMDLYEEDGKLVAEVVLPNFTKDEVKVDVDEGVLQVTAEHTEKGEEKGKRRYFFRESRDHYLRRVALPEGVDADKAEANFEDNVLKVTMPIAPSTKAKEVAVK